MESCPRTFVFLAPHTQRIRPDHWFLWLNVVKLSHLVDAEYRNRMYDDKQNQGVFNEEEIGWWDMGGGRRKERIVRQRKRNVGRLTSFPWLEGLLVWRRGRW